MSVWVKFSCHYVYLRDTDGDEEQPPALAGKGHAVGEGTFG